MLNCQDRAHGPLGSLLALLRVLIHLEIDNAANHEVILDLVGSQVVIAGPQGPQHDLSTGLLLWKLGNVVIELDINTILVATKHVSPDAEHDVSTALDHVQDINLGLVSLSTALVLLILVLSDLLRGQFRVHVHELEDLGADFVVLLKFNLSQNLDVLVAPVLHLLVVHGLGLSELVLH